VDARVENSGQRGSVVYSTRSILCVRKLDMQIRIRSNFGMTKSDCGMQKGSKYLQEHLLAALAFNIPRNTVVVQSGDCQ
jgi:hypothetical protein